jgi:hypothetical protein
MRAAPLVLALIPALAAAGPGTAKTEIKASGTTTKNYGRCGARILPLVEGNTWTYEQVAAPTEPDEKIKRLSPVEPKRIVISVKTIETKKGETVVTMEEKVTTDLTRSENKPVIDDHVIATTITCSATKFEISPDSFFFAGEPGGYRGLELADLQRTKDTSLKLVGGTVGDKEWLEFITARWTRIPTQGSDAKLGSGKLELERKFTPYQPEVMITRIGSYHAEKLGLVTTGRVTLDGAAPDAKPMELPAGWNSTLWLAEGVGMVQALNSYAHQYQLVEVQLK